MGLARRLAGGVGIGFIGVLSLFGCAATTPPDEDLAASRAIAVPRAHTAPSGADTEIDPDCPYLTVEVSTPGVGFDLEKSRALQETQRPYMEKFSAHLERVESKQATWAVESTVKEIPEPMRIGRPQGDRRLVWSWTMSKFPSVLDGALRVDLFTHHEFSNPRRRIERISQLRLTTKGNFGIRASNDADLAASVFLPHARQLCADMSATLSEEEAELERIRDQLTEEIMRVRKRRVEQEKQLEIEVEH